MPTLNYGINPKSTPVSVGAKLRRKNIALAILGVSLFISTFYIPYESFLPAWGQYDVSYELSPGGSDNFRINPGFGGTVQFMLVVDRECILHLIIKNEEKQIIIDQILSSGEYFYSIPSVSGIYNVLHKPSVYNASLENDGSSVQYISWIFWVYYYNTTFQLIGITFSALGCLMLVAHRKKREEEEIQTTIQSIITQDKVDTKEYKKPFSSSDTVEEAKKILQDLKEKKSA